MAKLSLSGAMKNRKRIRVVTTLAVMLLLFFGISMMVSNNPKGTRAAWDVGSSFCNLAYFGTPVAQTLSATDLSCEGKDVTVDAANVANGAILTVAGTHHFKSLIVQNGGVVTHEALTVAEASSCDTNGNYSILDSADPQTAECINARNKKVDIEVEGDITLFSGGSINVDEKGYPGGHVDIDRVCQNNAYGPGRGGDCKYQDNVSGNGGSFGGYGNSSFGAAFTNVGSIYNYLSSSGELEFGSGGGAVGYNGGGGDYAGSKGGAGGGRIMLKCGNLITNPGTYISADGGFGLTIGTEINITGGGGSGGVIVVDADTINMGSETVRNSQSPSGNPYPTKVEGLPDDSGEIPFKFSATVAGGKNQTDNTGNDSSDHYGSDGVLQIRNANNTVGSLFQMSAQGGRACGRYASKFCSGRDNPFDNYDTRVDGSGGGGGWIVVQKDIEQLVTIKKALQPISRPGAPAGDCTPAVGATNCFNPYALQKGDRIKVNLEVTNLVPGTLILTDEMLKVPYSTLDTAFCDYQASTLLEGVVPISAASQTYDDTGPIPELEWNYTVEADDTNTSKTFSYECLVR